MALDIKQGCIELAHGSGGRASHELIENLFIPAFDPEKLNLGEDQATLPRPEGRIVMATDSHVISPIFFAGGDIGSLAVHGTINDICMSGAVPLSMSLGLVLEEGFPLSDLNKIVNSIALAAKQSHIKIVTGDTKVVEKGQADGIFINSTAIGVLPPHLNLSARQIQVGDKVLVSGTLGDHGVTIQTHREGLNFDSSLRSDSQALDSLVKAMVSAVPQIRCMRDPTRGGLAAVLHEWSRSSELGFSIQEHALPVRDEVLAVTELLGLDPINIANEGKLVVVCPAERAEYLESLMQAHPQGKDARIIGSVTDEARQVELETNFGGKRLIDWPWSDPLPRIC